MRGVAETVPRRTAARRILRTAHVCVLCGLALPALFLIVAELGGNFLHGRLSIGLRNPRLAIAIGLPDEWERWMIGFRGRSIWLRASRWAEEGVAFDSDEGLYDHDEPPYVFEQLLHRWGPITWWGYTTQSELKVIDGPVKGATAIAIPLWASWLAAALLAIYPAIFGWKSIWRTWRQVRQGRKVARETDLSEGDAPSEEALRDSRSPPSVIAETAVDMPSPAARERRLASRGLEQAPSRAALPRRMLQGLYAGVICGLLFPPLMFVCFELGSHLVRVEFWVQSGAYFLSIDLHPSYTRMADGWYASISGQSVLLQVHRRPTDPVRLSFTRGGWCGSVHAFLSTARGAFPV